MFEKNIEQHKTPTIEHKLQNKGHFLSENKRIIHVVERAVGRSENEERSGHEEIRRIFEGKCFCFMMLPKYGGFSIYA